jgi:hypothetical protein
MERCARNIPSRGLRESIKACGVIDQDASATTERVVAGGRMMEVARVKITEAGRRVPLILKRASASRPSGEWSEDDYDVLADGVVVGRIFRAAASPEG